MNQGFILKFHKSKWFKVVVIYMLFSFVFDVIYPTVSLAVTSPISSDFTGFEQASNSDLVDLYSGDFKYNIPLMSVPGPNGSYPLNLSYQSNIGMEEESSLVGLGWNLNVGAINRQLRGLPDDFKGENIAYKMHLKPNVTVKYELPYTFNFSDLKKPQKDIKNEKFGLDLNSLNNLTITEQLKKIRFEVFVNNIKGLGISASNAISLKFPCKYLPSNQLKLGYGFNSQSGLSFSPTLDLGSEYMKLSMGVNFQTTEGMTGYHLGYGLFNKYFSSTSGALSFGLNQSLPTISTPMQTKVTPIDFEIGKAVEFGFLAKGPKIIKGMVSVTKVANGGNINSNGYGYMYNSESNDESMRDMNRMEFQNSEHTPYLSPSYFTYDLYSYSGQGTGGTFRPFQSSVQHISTKKVESKTKVKKKTIEFGNNPKNYHVGFEIAPTKGKNSTEPLIDGTVAFSKSRKNESVYFVDLNEMTGDVDIESDYLQWKSEVALKKQTDINDDDGYFSENYYFKNNYINSINDLSNNLSFDANKIQRKYRKKRTTHIQAITKSDYTEQGFRPAPVFSGYMNDNHIVEMIVTHSDGMKYIYSEPIYNKTQKEVVMSVTQPSNYVDQNRVNLTNGEDYKSTKLQYLSSKELPPYANTWLLSYVVSADYIDVNNNGPDKSDYGFWVKFNYETVHEDYQWRMPYKQSLYIKGKLSDDKDDMASYSYGTKQVKILTQIETKTHIAKFENSDRTYDGYEAHSEITNDNDPIGLRTLKKLDRISLYSKNDSLKPIKQAVFTYDNSLCKSADNAVAGYGKLTLKKLHFVYNNHPRGEYNPYVFKYSEINKEYEPNNVDRWGNYKTINSVSNFPEADFPYTNQEFTLVNGKKISTESIAPWSLKMIDLPTGSSIEINYESDDYAYVEDRKAQRMYDVIKIGDSDFSTNKGDDAKYTISGEKLYINLEEEIPDNVSGGSDEYFKKNYIGNLNKIWFKTLIKIREVKFPQNDYYDYVQGYADLNLSIGNYGVVKDSDNKNTIGYVTLNKVSLNKNGLFGRKVNPFTKAAIQYLQTERPDLVHDSKDVQWGNPMGVVGKFALQVVNVLPTLLQAFTGFNTYAYSVLDCGGKLVLGGNTIIRLQDSDGIKFGGGSRVSKIIVHDNWYEGRDSNYGQEYDYTIEEDGRTISSGVAYEPIAGGEESALREPVDFSESAFLGTSKQFYVEKPLLEGYYPGAGVGYRKVVVKSIAPSEAAKSTNYLTKYTSSAPISVYEFYTPKDFPVIPAVTEISNEPTFYRGALIPIVYSFLRKRKIKSQGYSIILNDMAGKLKKVSTFTRPLTADESPKLVSSKQYIYNTANEYNEFGANELLNEVDTYQYDPVSGIKRNKAIIGQQIDMFVDQWQNIESSVTKGVDANIEIDFLTFPYVIPIPIPEYAETESTEKFSVTMKIIHRKGILKKVIETTENSKIITENHVFDHQTGEALVTSVTNEFENKQYAMNFPGYWYYDQGMGHLSDRLNYVIDNTNMSLNQGVLTGVNVSDNELKIGDQLSLTVNGNKFKYYVSSISSSNYLLTPISGSPSSSNLSISSIKIIKPIDKNLISAKVGSISFMGLDYDSLKKPIFSRIINAAATEMSDDWKVDCVVDGLISGSNPYAKGTKGRFKPKKSYSYKVNRVYGGNIAQDGYFSNFSFFPWRNVNSKSSNWVLSNEVTMYSRLGNQVESKNALGLYASSTYGYGGDFTNAIGSNAKNQQLGTDGFEDYDYYNFYNHFGFLLFKNNVTTEESHSGKRSIKVENGKTIKMRRAIKSCN
jgi:hypothetical protein